MIVSVLASVRAAAAGDEPTAPAVVVDPAAAAVVPAEAVVPAAAVVPGAAVVAGAAVVPAGAAVDEDDLESLEQAARNAAIAAAPPAINERRGEPEEPWLDRRHALVVVIKDRRVRLVHGSVSPSFVDRCSFAGARPPAERLSASGTPG